MMTDKRRTSNSVIGEFNFDRMKTTACLLTAFASLTMINCSAAPKTKTENANIAWQNSSEMTSAANAPTPAPPAENQAQTASPDALVKELYKTHEKNPGAIVQGKNRAVLDKYFDKNLANLIWKDVTTHDGEIGVIDFDIFYNTQDPDIKNLAVGAPKMTGDKAIVPVTFVNYTTKNTVTYSLVKENAAWKIADINYGGADSLVKYFKEAAAEDAVTAPASGEFEGKYRIGDTTCTVTPVKMAFEVRWEKGAGAEMFFYKESDNGKQIFESDPKAGKANSFAFDDENYDAGTFYRADGKQFPIERIR